MNVQLDRFRVENIARVPLSHPFISLLRVFCFLHPAFAT
jgi:hypothetical protein